jgi:probable blue pigment (indigoidine) exporter
MVNKPLSPILTGVLFAIFWASASVAGKIGLLSVEPLVLFNIRFLGAGIVLLFYVYVIQRNRLPVSKEWTQLTFFGAFNTTLYLGLFVLALQQVTPGITTLAVALNPLFISIFSAIWMRRKVLIREWLGIAIGSGGVFIAAFPHLETSYATPQGLVLLAMSQVAYSIGAVYYAAVTWQLSRTTVNAWQVFIGGVLIVPFTLILHEKDNHFDLRFLLSLSWLIFPVSILAIQLWLQLLKTDAVRASMWLYLCPVFGFLYAAFFLSEPITWHTFLGTALVMAALYISQRKFSPSES